MLGGVGGTVGSRGRVWGNGEIGFAGAVIG